MQLVLYQKMKTVDLHEYDEKFIKMVKDFCLKTLDSAFQSKTSLEDFGLEIFNPLIEDNCPINFCETAVSYLDELLKHPMCKSQVFKYLQKCLENVKIGQSVPQSLKLFKLLITNPYLLNLHEENIKKLNVNCGGIIEKILKNFEEYMKKSNGDYDSIIEGRYNHRDNIKIRLKTIEYFMRTEILDVNFDHFSVI
jgi:hypothetical protein